MKRVQKGNTVLIAVIVAVVAITAAVVGWIFAKQSQEPVQPVATQPTASGTQTQPQTANPTLTISADWQTYTNAKSAYSISIPKEWTSKEQLPAPFVATEFFGDDKNKRILLVDRFETTVQANNKVKKDFIAWANENYINMDLGYGDTGCKDGVVKVKSTMKGDYPAVVIDCPKRDTESYVVFTQDRNYLIESPLNYKNGNFDLYNKIYSTFEVK